VAPWLLAAGWLGQGVGWQQKGLPVLLAGVARQSVLLGQSALLTAFCGVVEQLRAVGQH